MTRETAAGGAATISGVIYQILWCLLRSLRVHVADTQEILQGECLPPTIFILEPSGGGGDLQVSSSTVYIEQLKARADGGTWSLKQVISEVLPDMFLAVPKQGGRPCRYRMVTEGRMGDWAEVHSFFKRLRDRDSGDQLLNALDNSAPVRFRKTRSRTDSRPPLFPLSEYTERSLFLRIADELKQRPAINQLQLEDYVFHEYLWQLLAGFEFVAEQALTVIERDIDALLLAVVDRREEIPQKRQALAMSLLTFASAGNAEFEPEAFLAANGLQATPLVRWASLRDAARQELQNTQRLNRFDPTLDVRSGLARSLYAQWQTGNRILVITGEGGSGKTWTLHALAKLALADEAPVVWVDASGDTDKDLQSASDRFWLDIRKGNESPIRLRQLAQRLADVVHFVSPPRLRIFLDNVPTFGEALSIIQDNWPEMAIQIAFSCPQPVADSLASNSQHAAIIARCEDLTWEELHNYLQRRLGEEWSHVPDDVRDTLRRPLLARIYADDLFDSEWKPTNEYELYDRVWKRLKTGHQSQFPMDAVLVEALARTVLAGAPYPWTCQQCLDAGIDSTILQRLERCGWFERSTDGRIRVLHDRLLNWAVAQSLLSDLQGGRISNSQLVEQITEISRRDGRFPQVFLGYVPLDFLWLASGDRALSEQLLPELLASLEQTNHRHEDSFYRDLIKTLGNRISRALFMRILSFDGYPWVLTAILDSLADVAKEQICEFGSELLDSNEHHLQRRGVKLLRRTACPALLDKLWELHCRAKLDPTLWLEEHEEKWLLYEDTFGALKTAAKGHPDWIVAAIDAADPSTEPVHDLGWLVAREDDGAAIWIRSKQALFSKVDAQKPRVLAANIARFRDHNEIAWLQTQVGNRKDMVGAVSLQALSRISPDIAVEYLVPIDELDLYMTRSWSLRKVFHRRPGQTLAKLLQRMQDVEDPWIIASSLCDNPSLMTSEMLNFLIDDLSVKLQSTPCDGEHRDKYYRELRLLAGIHHPTLLDVLRDRRGAEFEDRLVGYLQDVGPQRGTWRNSLSRTSALALLRTIGGSGFPRVVNDFLQCDDRLGRLEALEWAPRQCNKMTYVLLNNLVAKSETWDGGHPLEQNHGMEALSIQGRWRDVAVGLCQWGLRCSYDLTEHRVAPADISFETVQAVRDAIAASVSPGTIEALAFCGTIEDISTIHKILQEADPASEIAHACIIGLELLNDSSDTGVNLVADQLQQKAHHFSAVRMLTAAGTPAAWSALFADLNQTFNHIIALNLINLSDFSEDVLLLTKQELPKSQQFGEEALLSLLIRKIRSPKHKQTLLSDPWLRERLHREAVAPEGRSWISCSKVDAIHCLAEFDSNAAFDAAYRGLISEHWHDREQYPAVLMRIDPERASRVLLQHICGETSKLVRYAIGRALAKWSMQDALRTYFRSLAVEQRIAASYVAGFASHGDSLHAELEAALDDPNDKVISNAMESLERIHCRDACVSLRARAIAAETTEEKWLYLDHLVEWVDPGLDHEPWPEVLRDIGPEVPHLVAKRLSKRLQHRRKKLADSLKKEVST